MGRLRRRRFRRGRELALRMRPRLLTSYPTAGPRLGLGPGWEVSGEKRVRRVMRGTTKNTLITVMEIITNTRPIITTNYHPLLRTITITHPPEQAAPRPQPPPPSCAALPRPWMISPGTGFLHRNKTVTSIDATADITAPCVISTKISSNTGQGHDASRRRFDSASISSRHHSWTPGPQ